MRRKQAGVALLAWALLGVLRVGAAAESAAPDWGQVGERAATRLAEYLRIDTQNPPGRTVEAVAFLADAARAAGLEVERFGGAPDKPILLARLRGRGGEKKPIVLLNHTDIVPADPATWSFPPLAGDIRDGEVRGRGALDMKGFGVVQLEALRLLAERGEVPRHDIVFLAVPDEEIGGTMGTAWLVQNRPDVMDAAAVWDEGGYGITDAFGAPLLFISVTEKKVLWLRLVAEGPAGHGSRPFPEAAPRRLQQALERIFTNLPAPRLTPLARQVFREIGSVTPGMEGFALRRLKNPLVWLFADGLLQQDPLTNALVRDTIALTMLQAGYQPNVIPERAEAVLDCRLLPDTDQQAFLAALQRTIDDPAVRIEIMQGSEAADASPTNHPLFAAIEAAARRVYPAAVVTPTMTVVGADSRFFRRRGVPAYGFIPVLLTKDLAASVHGIDERIPISALGPAVRVVYEALRQM